MRSLHCVGIGGAGLSAIARVMLERGHAVSGSDLQATATTDALAASGAYITIGHRAANVHGAEQLLVSSAVPQDNPELEEARRLGIPVLKRSQFMNALIANQKAIAIAGTHGKTTTTALVALMLKRAGLDPSFVVGGTVPQLGANAGAGRGLYFVIEADEYDGMFLGLRPWIAVITNIELDHVDCYPTLEEASLAYARFAGHTQSTGMILACADCATGLQAARAGLAASVATSPPWLVTYGLDVDADWRVADVRAHSMGGGSFRALRGGVEFGQFDLMLPGRHNMANALAVIAVGAFLGLEPSVIAEAFREFQGVARRFELRGEAAGVTVIDDYAHHPTAVRATLAAARSRFSGRRIWAIFQPHTFSRTVALLDAFTDAFSDADKVVITSIYAAREKDDGRVSSQDLACRIIGPPVIYSRSLEDAAEYVRENVQSGDVVVTLGAGDGNLVGEMLLDVLPGQGVCDGTGNVR